MRSLFVLTLLAGLATVGTKAHAHPMVSTDINRHVVLTVTQDTLVIRYIYEMLEIAAINAARSADTDGDGSATDEERKAYVSRWANELESALHVTLGKDALALRLQSANWELGSAPFGLSTWKITAQLSAPLPGTEKGVLAYRDRLRPQDAGWKEVVLAGEEKVRIENADAGSQDRSQALTDYRAMADLPNPDQTSATARLVFPGTSNLAAKTRVRVRKDGEGPRANKPIVPGKLGLKESGGTAQAPSSVEAAAFAPAAQGSAAAASLWTQYAMPFFKLGMFHIATGWDHLAFLLGLLLFRQSLRRLAWVLTAFTLAHSLTLALAALGWVTPPDRWVEALIAVSIAYVGAVALWRPDIEHGPVIAFGFGLMHGFGFAGALSEALGDTGGSSWLLALAGFNLGIETFQLALVLLLFPILWKLDRFRGAMAVRRTLAVIVMALGLWWTWERVVGA